MTSPSKPTPPAGRLVFVPDDCQIVPKQITSEQLVAFDHYNEHHIVGEWNFIEAYGAVLAAAPSPTSTRIDNWHGKPIERLSRGELIDALDWSVNRQRELLKELSVAHEGEAPGPVPLTAMAATSASVSHRDGPSPVSVHWLGERHEAHATGHEMDFRGCVLYFERQSECLAFMGRVQPANVPAGAAKSDWVQSGDKTETVRENRDNATRLDPLPMFSPPAGEGEIEAPGAAIRRLETIRETIAGEPGPENLYTEEQFDRMYIAAIEELQKPSRLSQPQIEPAREPLARALYNGRDFASEGVPWERLETLGDEGVAAKESYGRLADIALEVTAARAMPTKEEIARTLNICRNDGVGRTYEFYKFDEGSRTPGTMEEISADFAGARAVLALFAKVSPASVTITEEMIHAAALAWINKVRIQNGLTVLQAVPECDQTEWLSRARVALTAAFAIQAEKDEK